MANSGNPYRRARTGEPLRIPAQTYNEMLSALSGGGLAISDRSVSVDGNTAVVYIRNDTGADLARYSVFGIGGPVFPPDATDTGAQAAFEHGVYLSGVTPTAAHSGAFAIAIEPIRSGGVGLVMLTGATLARVEMTSESDRWADVKVGDPSRLVSGSGTAQLLWVQPAAQRGSQGFAWCVVRLGVGGSGEVSPVRTGIVVGYVVGPRSGVNSAFSCRDMDASGNPVGSSYTVAAISHGTNQSEWGTHRLDQCMPHKRVGDPVKFVEMNFLGATRRVAIAEFQLAGCGI
jgi:hypothetical protein